MTDESQVLYETRGPVALITLNRPNALNAISIQMRAELADAQKRAETDENVRVVILTGNGRGFSAGTDIPEMHMHGHATVTDHVMKDYKPLIDAIGQSQKIYIAAINGVCAGVALGLALNCDLAIMSDTAFLMMPFANIGLVPDGGSSWMFLQQLGYKRSLQAILEGDRLDANFCVTHGLANKSAPADDLIEQAIEWGNKLVTKAPLSVKYSKRILRAGLSQTLDDATYFEAVCQHHCETSEDAKEGIQAFMEKRKPVFKGR